MFNRALIFARKVAILPSNLSILAGNQATQNTLTSSNIQPLLASRFYRKATDQNNFKKQFTLAESHYFSEKKEDRPQGIKLLKELSDIGYAPAQWTLGVFYNSGYCVENDTKRGLQLYIKAARQGDSNAFKLLNELIKDHEISNVNDLNMAYCALGRSYIYGIGDIKKDLVKGVNFLIEAARRNDSESISLLNDIAPELIRAEKEGDNKVRNVLAACYCEGFGVEKDVLKGLSLFESSYSKHEIYALYESIAEENKQNDRLTTGKFSKKIIDEKDKTTEMNSNPPANTKRR